MHARHSNLQLHIFANSGPLTQPHILFFDQTLK